MDKKLNEFFAIFAIFWLYYKTQGFRQTSTSSLWMTSLKKQVKVQSNKALLRSVVFLKRQKNRNIHSFYVTKLPATFNLLMTFFICDFQIKQPTPKTGKITSINIFFHFPSTKRKRKKNNFLDIESLTAAIETFFIRKWLYDVERRGEMGEVSTY